MRLFGFERRWLLSIFDTMLPSGASEQLSLGARDLPLERFVADVEANVPGRILLGLRAATWLVTFAPLLLLRRFRRFPRLPRDDRLVLLDRLSHSRIYLLREIPVLLKMVACLGYCGMPEVQRQVGYEQVATEPPEWARGEGS